MIIYIAGPISTDPNYKEKFARAEKLLAGQGHSVINPAFLPTDLGDCTRYMHLCFPMIDVCDAVYMLPGWEQSYGACREWGYAQALDKIVVHFKIEEMNAEEEAAEFRPCTECQRLASCDRERQWYHKQMGTPCLYFKEKEDNGR